MSIFRGKYKTGDRFKVLSFAGVVLVMAAAGHGLIWIGMAVLVNALGYLTLVYLTPARTAEEEARKNAAWLAEIDRGYKKVRSVEDRLDELERLKRRDMVTTEEYTAKRQEILKDL